MKHQQPSAQSLEPIRLMGDIKPGPFQSVEERVVNISTNANDKQIYNQAYDGRNGGVQWALTGTGIIALVNESGIQPIQGGNYPVAGSVVHPHVISWHFEAQWGNGVLMGAADYTLDLRDWIVGAGGETVRGPRFDEASAKHRDALVNKEMAKVGKAIPDGTSKDEKIIQREMFFLGLPAETADKLNKLADVLALNEIRQQRIHMARKAQSGAMLAAYRKMLGLKSGYSTQELTRGFVVYRLRDDFELMRKALGEDNMQVLMMSAATKYFGLTAGALADTVKHLKAPATEPAGDQLLVANMAAAQAEAAKIAHESVADLDDGDEETPELYVQEMQGDPPMPEEPETDINGNLVNPTPVAETPKETFEASKVQVPWLMGKYLATNELLEGERDQMLIARAKRMITPKKHLENHLQSHYQIERWGQMTIGQGVKLWMHLDAEEKKAAK